MGVTLGTPPPQFSKDRLLPFNAVDACKFTLDESPSVPRNEKLPRPQDWTPDYASHTPVDKIKQNWQSPAHTALEVLDSWAAFSGAKADDPLMQRLGDLIKVNSHPPASVFSNWDTCYPEPPAISIASGF